MQLAQELLRRSDWCVLDTETTGLGSGAEIVQLGVLSPQGEVLLDTFVKPVRPIPPEVTAIHGITDLMVAGAPTFKDVYPKLVVVTQGKSVVVYNAAYDFQMVRQSIVYSFGLNIFEDSDVLDSLLSSVGDDWLCVMNAYAEYWGEWNSYYGSYTWQSLAKACRQQSVCVKDAHSAIGDCRMTLALIQKLGVEIGE